MPHVYSMAVQAARILGMERMPNIYVSGARPWDALTFGSDDDAFILLGSALASCFQKSDLMFIFAREMGHILAGHALWKTVIQFLVGEQRNNGGGMMKHGLAGLLAPGRLIEGAIELPLISWARQAEITADRAGLLVSSGLDQARRVLMMWSLKSPMLYRHVNIDAWMEQQSLDIADENIRMAELVSSSTPYLTRRVQLMQEYDQSLIVKQFRKQIMKLGRKASTNQTSHDNAEEGNDDVKKGNFEPIRFSCPSCGKLNSIEVENANEQSKIAVKCANEKCKKITLLTAKPTDDISFNGTVASNPELSQMSE